MTITPAHYSNYSKAQRRLLTTFGGLGVAALAAGTFVLSYEDLRLLALRGGAARHWAFLYPGMLDGLVVVIILAILTARRSGWFSRAVRWLLLILLIAGAGAAGIERAVKGYEALPDTWVDVGVAVAPWAILIIAVWLWTGIIKQALSRRVRTDETERAVEPAPATVVDKSIIPGLDAETRSLPRPAAPIRELAPVRETAPPAPAEPEPNPWDAARLDPETDRVSGWERADEATGPDEPVPPSWRDLATDTAPPDVFWGGDESDRTATAPNPVQAEPSDPVPDSWRAPETDESPSPREPLLPPALRRDDLPEEPVRPKAPAASEPPDPKVEAPMNSERDEEPAPRLVARTSLPTDVRLVGGPKPALTDTQPDGIKLPDTKPDGIPIVVAASSDDDDDEADAADERAEDPDAGDDMAATPPSSKFRSGPTPPRG
jgi:Protein of unknown function (DUF2637)